MRKIIFNCETITPLFLGEAIKGLVELRPPAIKASMRFWWRSMHAHLSLADLKKKEAEIFGGGGEHANCSTFDIIVENVRGNIEPYNYTDRNSDNNTKIEGVDKNGTQIGLQYFMYTFFHLKNHGSFYSCGTLFDVTFYFDNDTHINEILASFWLLTFLGNLGERSRRGMGGFRIIQIIDNENTKGGFEFIDNNPATIKQRIEEIETLFKRGQVSTTTYLNSYSILNKEEIYYASKDSITTWEEALNEIGLKLKNSRLDEYNHTKISSEKSAAFGLPVRHRNNFTVTPKDFTRRASPLIIKVLKLNNNTFRWLLVKFDGEFLPATKNLLSTGNQADISALADFINILNKVKI